MSEPQPQVYEYAEDKDTGELKELPEAECFSQQGNLRKKHKRIDEERTCSHREIAYPGNNVWYAGYGGCSQLGVGYYSDAIPHEKRLAKKTSQRLQRSFDTFIGASRKDKIKQMLFYSILIIRARPVFNTKAGAEVVSAGRSIFLQYKET